MTFARVELNLKAPKNYPLKGGGTCRLSPGPNHVPHERFDALDTDHPLVERDRAGNVYAYKGRYTKGPDGTYRRSRKAEA